MIVATSALARKCVSTVLYCTCHADASIGTEPYAAVAWIGLDLRIVPFASPAIPDGTE